MLLTMKREPSVGGATLSKLYAGDSFVCDILEDEVRELPGVPVEEWKIHGVTAIPAGTYLITFENSGRFGPETMTLRDVPGYKYIRIHGGNRSTDTEGCLLPGSRNSANTVTMSQAALKTLKYLVAAAMKRGETVRIKIAPHGGA